MAIVVRFQCPECLSDKLVKMGVVWSGRKLKQQWRCNACGRLTIKPITATKIAQCTK